MFLSVQLLCTSATYMDYTVDLTGEFSPGKYLKISNTQLSESFSRAFLTEFCAGGQGGTPFGPFPVMFPSQHDNHMVEAIVSDYTINSLLYWLHK